MASSDATPIPKKGVAYRLTVPILDADGDLVTGAAALDSEVSKDAGTFTDCTNEATEIATSSGFYYLDLTATEMNADTVAVMVKTTTSGAKTTPIVLYPVEDGDIPVNLTQWRGSQPNVLLSGRPDSNVGALTTNVLTASHPSVTFRQIMALETMLYPTSSIEAAASTRRTLYEVIAALTHKREISGNNIILYKSDDTTVLATIPIMTDATLDPIKTIDPPA